VRQRSNIIVVLGLVVFLVGGAATYLIVHGHGEGNASAATVTGSGAGVELVAVKPIPAGTRGDQAVSQGLVTSKSIKLVDKPTGAFAITSDLYGKVAQSDIPAGSVLMGSQFSAAQTVIGTVQIPAGKTALAVQLNNLNGVAGFAAAGDKIDIFGVLKQAPLNTPGGQVRTHLIMQGVDVLRVNNATLAPVQGQPGAPALIFLLAVTPDQAERLIYLQTFEDMYFTLLPKNAQLVPFTPGAGPNGAVLNPMP
jgi:Flp pilus assembly protein CpaB